MVVKNFTISLDPISIVMRYGIRQQIAIEWNPRYQMIIKPGVFSTVIPKGTRIIFRNMRAIRPANSSNLSCL
jgi:hypothetical protein